MNRTEVQATSKEVAIKEKRSFDKRAKKHANAATVTPAFLSSEIILERNLHLNRSVLSGIPTNGKVIEIDIDKNPPKVIAPPLAEYEVLPPTDETRKYFGLRAPKAFHEQVMWLKHRSEIATVSPLDAAVAHQTNRPLHISPPRNPTLQPIVSPTKSNSKSRNGSYSLAESMGLESMHSHLQEKLHIHTGSKFNTPSPVKKGGRTEFLKGGKRKEDFGVTINSEEQASVEAPTEAEAPVESGAPINSVSVREQVQEEPQVSIRKELNALRASMKSSLDEMMAMEPVPLTPRSRYIENCFKDKLNPRAYLVLRKSDTTELLLAHMGIGDKMGKAVADSFKDLPKVRVVDLADNNFTDKALAPIIKALHTNAGVTFLNVSDNNIGTKTSQALADFIASSECKLETLCLSCTGVHDGAAQMFLTPMRSNTTLTHLDLSNNLLGVSETLNAVRKDLITGGKALAQVLSSPTCRISTLKMGWNMLRVGSAVEFSRSLNHNSSLTHLDLNFNAIGSEGGIALGHALLDNKTLRSLQVSTNGLDATACLTISASAMENRSLRRLVLDGNPLHDQGAHGAMLVSVMGSNNLQISLENCNVGSRDKNCTMDFTNICGSYELILSDPYQRALAILLLRIVACHHTFLVGKCTYEERRGSHHHETLQLVPCWLNDRSPTAEAEAADESRLVLQSGLRRLLDACSDRTSARQFFEYVDTDNSGEIDRDEFGELLASIGIDLDNTRLDATFDQYDLDRGGTIGMTEFFVFLKREKPHAERRLRDLTHAPALCLGRSLGTRYVPPARGVLHLTIIDGFQRKEVYKTLTGVDRRNIIQAAGSPADRAALTLHAISGVRLRFDDALALYKSMAETASKAKVLSALLAVVASPAEAKALVSAAIGGNKTEALALKRSLGSAVRPLTGIFNGYYSLDLSKELDRICLIRLLEFSHNQAQARASQSLIGDARVPDLSQRGNGNSSFRNEYYNGSPIILDDKFASTLPNMGHLCFDYSVTHRPPPHAPIASDVRVIKGLVDCFLISRRQLDRGLRKLKVLKELCDQTLQGDGSTLFELDMESACSICDIQTAFYEHLAERSDAMESAQADECISINYEAEVMRKYNIPSPARHYTHGPNSPQKDEFSFQSSPSPKKLKSVVVNAVSVTKPATVVVATPQNTSSKVSISFPPNSARGEAGKSSKAASLSNKAPLSSARDQGPAQTSSKIFRSMSNGLFASGKAQAGVSLSRKTIEENPFLALYEDVVDEVVGDTDITDDNGRCPGTILMHEGKVLDELVDANGYPIRLKAPVARSSSIGGTDLHIHPGMHGNDSTKGSLMQYNNNNGARKDVLEFHSKFSALMLSEEVSRSAKALRLVELIEDVFSPLYLYARHVALIMELFAELGSIPRTDYFGTYRVEACITLLDRIVDLHNIDVVLRVLTLHEIACLYCRVGWLSLFNPMKPEGSYCLDLSRYEERVVCKILCALQTNEPGENLRKLEFAWERKVEPTPKCEVIEAWLTEAGLHRRGFVYLTYFGGAGRGLKDCKPNTGLRRALMQLVLAREEDVIPDEERDFSWDALLRYDVNEEDPAVEQHKQDMAARVAANSYLWRNYLVPGCGAAGARPKKKDTGVTAVTTHGNSQQKGH